MKYKNVAIAMAKEIADLRACVDIEDGDFQGNNAKRYNEREILKDYVEECRLECLD